MEKNGDDSTCKQSEKIRMKKRMKMRMNKRVLNISELIKTISTDKILYLEVMID